MRISDWSSDVCSSDLHDGVDLLGGGPVGLWDDGTPPPTDPVQAARIGLSAGAEHPWRWYVADRKSVVSGKSVSVRVDLGGLRIIKNKTMKLILSRIEAQSVAPQMILYKSEATI